MTSALLGSIKAKKQGLLALVRDLPAGIHHLLNDIDLGEALEVLRQIPDNSNQTHHPFYRYSNKGGSR